MGLSDANLFPLSDPERSADRCGDPKTLAPSPGHKTGLDDVQFFFVDDEADTAENCVPKMPECAGGCLHAPSQ
jgi:hypothetical protein